MKASMKACIKAYRATILNPQSFEKVDIHEDSYLVIDENGLVVEICQTLDHERYQKRYKDILVFDHSNQLIVPGFIDAHTHLPQYAFAGTGDLPLLPWLEKYTFPQEERFRSAEVAQIEADNFFQSLLGNGTTSVVAYVTSNHQATDIAFASAQKHGVRAFLGQVLMNQNAAKNLLIDTAEAKEQNQALLQKWHKKKNLEFVITPRFAVSCSSDMLTMAGELSEQYDAFIQTHLSENLDEIHFVKELFPKASSYTDVYYQHQCLTHKTLLGHCIHLGEDELTLIQRQRAIVAHCPTSNRFLGSGVMPLLKYLQRGIRVALGTDVAAGYSLAMPLEAKEAMESSKVYRMLHQEAPYANLSLASALYLITLGAAQVLNLESVTGNFSAGKQADFVIINDEQLHPLQNIDYLRREKLFGNGDERLSRLFYRFCEGAVQETYIAGNLVFKR